MSNDQKSVSTPKSLKTNTEVSSVKPSETHTDAPSSNRQVTFAELHNQIFLPGLGQLPKSMDCTPSSQQPKLRGLKMFATNYGLEVELRDRTGFIPWGNVAWCVFNIPDKERAKELDKGTDRGIPGYQGPTKVGTATVTNK